MQNISEKSNQCELEKLHLSGASQSWGALIYIDSTTWLVTHASENLTHYIACDFKEFIGSPISQWCDFSEMIRKVPDADGAYSTRFNQTVGFTQAVDLRIIAGIHCVIIEIEPHVTNEEVIAITPLQRQLLIVPGTESGLLMQHKLLLEALYNIIQFDRLMIYRFHDDWSGEVLAEHTRDEHGSYLHLRFPAADIPAIARNLYLINPCRYIPDAAQSAINIASLDSSTPDLTYSDLRSVSPVHLQYLANMGVGASFSVPIKIAGKLWGLVACHNHSPKTISLASRDACVALTSTYSLCLSSYSSTRRMEMLDRIDHRIEEVLENITIQINPLDALQNESATLLKLMQADGLAMIINDEVVLIGDTLQMNDVAVFDTWFMAIDSKMYSTFNLSKEFYGKLIHASGVCGAVALKVCSARSGWIRLYWFRKEELFEIAWAGNPNKPATENTAVAALSPRRSFEKWIEVRNGYSRQWSVEDLAIASKFSSALLRWL
ncbi:MAG: GAF domain-containing protein [Moraxellaceae bacterium]|nr:MAG: GAF domain-containing protein [Moraxellaceae bacterium]